MRHELCRDGLDYVVMAHVSNVTGANRLATRLGLDGTRAGTQRLAANATRPGARSPPRGVPLARPELKLRRARVAYRHEEMTHLEKLTQDAPRVATMLLSGKTG